MIFISIAKFGKSTGEVLIFNIQCSFTRCRKTQAKLNRVKKDTFFSILDNYQTFQYYFLNYL